MRSQHACHVVRGSAASSCVKAGAFKSKAVQAPGTGAEYRHWASEAGQMPAIKWARGRQAACRSSVRTTACIASLCGCLQAAALRLVRPPVRAAAGLAAVAHSAAAAAAAQAASGAASLGCANPRRALRLLLLRCGLAV